MTAYSFGEFRLDTDRMELIGPAGPLETEPQVFDVLRYLVEQRGRLVTKEELLDNVWGDRFVSESALTTRIKQARRLVGDDGASQATIRTIRGRGFRFLENVVTDAATGPNGAGRARGLPRELDIEQTKPFVGRIDEVERAAAVLGRTAASAAWILLLGEPGIGKTRLAGRIAQLAVDQGATVLFGRCSEDLSVPYQPVIEALRAVLTDEARDQLASLGTVARELARLVPELLTEFPGLRPPDQADPETERHRLFEAVCAWLQAQAVERPLAVVVDDVHWATESTVKLLAHIARRALAAPVTFVMTARDTAPDLRSVVGDLVTIIESQPGNEVLRIRGLDVEAARELLDAEADVAEVVAQTAGNPLLIQALAGDEDGSIHIDTAVRRRTARLAPSVNDALIVAAVVGVEFDLKVVAAVLERDESEIIDDLDTAVEARLLEEVGVDRYRFTHGLVRATLRDTLSAARRARLHGHVAAALELVHAGHLERVATVIAHHYAAASAADPTLRHVAVDHLRNAARQAVEQLSFTEALELLDRASSLVESDDAGSRTMLAIERGHAEARAGLTQAALDSFDGAFGRARHAKRPDLMAEAALGYEDVSWRPGNFGGPSIERLTTALRAIDDADIDTRVRLLIALTRAYAMSGDVDRSDVTFQQVEPIVDELGDPQLEIQALGARYSTYLDIGPAPSLQPVLRLRTLCDRIDDVEAELLARQIHLRYMIRRGRMDDYRRGLQEMTEIVGQLHSSFWEYIRANHEAMLVLYEGDLAGAEHASARCAELGGRLLEDDTSGTLGLRMFMIRREQDRLKHLAPLVRTLVAADDTTTFWTPGLALLLVEIGYRDEAAAILRDFRDHDFELPVDAMWSTVMVMLIELATALHDIDSCTALAERFADQRGLAIVTGHGIACFGSGDRYLGMLAAAVGDLDLAESSLEDAIEFDHRNGGVLWANHARLQLSEVWARQGRCDEAAELRAAVRAVAERHGFAALRRLAAQEQAAAG